MKESEKIIKYMEILNRAFPNKPKDSNEILIRLLKRYNCQTVYIFHASQMVGGVVVVKVDSRLYGIELMAIHPKFQRQGYGRKLMDKVHKKFKGIFILSTMRSKNFYKKIGYTTVNKINERSYMQYVNLWDKWLL